MLRFSVKLGDIIPGFFHRNWWPLGKMPNMSEFSKMKLQTCDIVWRNLADCLHSERCTIGEHAPHHKHTFFDSVQPLLALSAQRALCTFFSLLLSASLLRCGLMVSSPEPWASSGGRLPEALFLVFRLESQGTKWLHPGRNRRSPAGCKSSIRTCTPPS